MTLNKLDAEEMINEWHDLKRQAKEITERELELKAELDEYLDSEGLKRLANPLGFWYGFSDVSPSFGLDNSPALWDYLEDCGFEHEDFCAHIIDQDKLVPYIVNGKVSGNVVMSHTVEKRKGYRRHTKGTLKS